MKPRLYASLACLLAAPSAFAGATPVLTYHNDGARTGANLEETVLNTSNVNVSGFGKIYTRPVDDQLYAQLLYMPAVNIPGRGTHNVVFAATVNNTVYAFDADYADLTGPLWKRSFLSPGVVAINHTDLSAAGSCGGNYNDFSGNMGIVGTPVIDPTPWAGAEEGDQGTLYVVARTKENGQFVQRLHALSVRTGEERPNSPVVISGSVAGTGSGSVNGVVTFNNLTQNQRPGLALVNGMVYICWASHCDLGPYHGWVMAYDKSTLQQQAIFNNTPDGSNGGIWMGGSPPSFDENGTLYLSTGNGTIGNGANDRSNVRNRGESFLRLTHSGSNISVSSFFTPYNYSQLESGDIDLGSAGLLLFPGANNSNLVIGAGKQGRLYVVNRDNMGGLQEGSDSQIVQSIDVNLNKKIMGGPVYWQGPGGVKKFYIWAADTTLKAYTYNGSTFNTTPQTSTATASNPGAMLSISANGSNSGTGIVWAMCPTSDANQAVVTGVLRAINAETPSQELWNSTQNSSRDAIGTYAKFNQVTVTNGRVYVPTFSNRVLVYGAIQTPVNPTAPATLVANGVSKTQIHLEWVDNSSNEAGFAIERSSDGTNFEQISNVDAGVTSYEDTSVTRFASYTYRVRAYTLTGSSLSNTSTGTTNVGSPEAGITLAGSGQVIVSGTTATSSANGTAFAQVLLGGSDGPHTFAIANVGTADLNLTGTPKVSIAGANPTDFVVTTAPGSPVATGSSTTFQITFTPTAAGTRTATVTIANDDPQSGSFTFAVSGVGTLQNLLGWWRFNEASPSTTAADSSGQQGTGTLTAPLPTWTTAGKLDSAITFTGVVGQSVTVPDAPILNPSSGLTISAWIYPTAWNSGANARVLQKGGSDNQYRLTVDGGVFKFQVAGVGILTHSTLPTLNAWTHVAGTYDGTIMRMFYNGVVVESAAASGAVPVTSDPLYIGTKLPTSSAGNHFIGRIDDVKLYGRGLTQSEVQTLAAQAGTVSVVATTATAQKGVGLNGLFTFTRTTGVTADLNVSFDLLPGVNQAVYRTDFGMSEIPPNLVIPTGQGNLTMTVTPLDFNSVTGTVDVTVKVVDGPGYAAGQNDTATVHILDSPINQWKIANFGSVANANSTAAADEASYTGDGVPNLLKYALGQNPVGPYQPAPAAATENIGGQDYLTLTFVRPKPTPAGITYIPESRPDLLLGAWDSAPVLPGYPIDNGDGTETVKVRTPTPVSDQERGFLRLRVTRP